MEIFSMNCATNYFFAKEKPKSLRAISGFFIVYISVVIPTETIEIYKVFKYFSSNPTWSDFHRKPI